MANSHIPIDAPACKTCRFWAKPSVDAICRRYPPKVVIENGLPEAIWPWINPNDWCGEFIFDASVA